MRAPEVLFLWAGLAWLKRFLIRFNARLYDAAEWFAGRERRLILSKFLAELGHELLKFNKWLTQMTRKLENYWKDGL